MHQDNHFVNRVLTLTMLKNQYEALSEAGKKDFQNDAQAEVNEWLMHSEDEIRDLRLCSFYTYTEGVPLAGKEPVYGWKVTVKYEDTETIC